MNPLPIRILGALRLNILGLRLGRIDLDLTIASQPFLRESLPTTSQRAIRIETALSHRELYQIAQEVALPGRSGMSKAELIEALAAHEASARGLAVDSLQQ